MKKIISLVLITVMALSALVLVSCGSKSEDLSDSKYLGKWKIASLEFQEVSDDFDEDWVIELNADGTGKSYAQGETDEFTWEPTDDGFKTKGDLKLDFTDDGDDIVADLYGAKLIFKRQE